ncbi:hypothetical protein EDD85DRAFT_838304 [Armillaria nabsnona]|nr:hypothetical protein EDD85DRAFT_838304 [Armillaria nabsnona]
MNFQPQSIDTNHSSTELHSSQPTGSVSRSSMTSSVPRPLGPDTVQTAQTSQPHPGFTAPILAIEGEATSNHFLPSRGSGSSLFSPATSNAQPVEPSSDTLILGMLQWDQKQQSIASGRQSFCRGSHDMNRPSMGLHPSPKFRQTSQPWIGPMVPILAPAGETTSTHVLSLYGSGSTTESLSSLTTTNVQPIEPSSGTSTLQVIELEDIKVTCLLCDVKFIGHQASSHLRENHSNLVRKNNRSFCPLCNTTSTTAPAKEVTNFYRHFQKHHKVFRFKCSGCSYAALERWNVERHVQKMRGKSKCVKDKSCRQSDNRGLRDGLVET